MVRYYSPGLAPPDGRVGPYARGGDSRVPLVNGKAAPPWSHRFTSTLGKGTSDPYPIDSS